VCDGPAGIRRIPQIGPKGSPDLDPVFLDPRDCHQKGIEPRILAQGRAKAISFKFLLGTASEYLYIWTDYSPYGLLVDHMAQLTLIPLAEMFDEILDPSIRLRIVELLVSLPVKEFTGREIARLLGVSHSNVQRALRVLVEDGLASKKRTGRADVFSANRDHFTFKALRDLFKVKRELSDRIEQDLLSAFQESGISVTVFGSYARGEADRRSDVDVLVITKDRTKLENKIGTIEADFARRYNVSLSAKVLSPFDLKRKPVLPYVREAAREGILISGIPIQRVTARA